MRNLEATQNQNNNALRVWNFIIYKKVYCYIITWCLAPIFVINKTVVRTKDRPKEKKSANLREFFFVFGNGFRLIAQTFDVPCTQLY